MIKIFLDSNIWLRFFLKDDQEQYEIVSTLYSLIEEGNFRPYTSTIVLLEINYILAKIYHQQINKIIRYITKIMEIRNITVLESTNLLKAIEIYRKYRIKLADCLIADQIKRDMILITFDQEFHKIAEINVMSPKRLLEKLALNHDN